MTLCNVCPEFVRVTFVESTREQGMHRGLVLSEQNAIPRRQLSRCVPSAEGELVELLDAAEGTLPVPHCLHNIAYVGWLQEMHDARVAALLLLFLAHSGQQCSEEREVGSLHGVVLVHDAGQTLAHCAHSRVDVKVIRGVVAVAVAAVVDAPALVDQRLHLLLACLGVELRCFNKLKKEMCDALSQPNKTGIATSPDDKIGLAVNQGQQLPRQLAVVLLHGVLHLKQHIQALIESERLLRHTFKYVSECASPDCAGRVHLCDLPVRVEPLLRRRNRVEEFFDTKVFCLLDSLALEPVNRGNERALLLQQLLHAGLALVVSELLCLDRTHHPLSPRLKSVVEEVKVITGAWVCGAGYCLLVRNLFLPEFSLLFLMLPHLLALSHFAHCLGTPPTKHSPRK
eukprot:Opistho-2@15460